MKISELYRMLCSLYGVSSPLDIDHYLVMACSSGSDELVGNSDISRETLLIRQTDEALEIGLFIDPSIICALESGDALDHLDELSCAAEGASHFLYVADRAGKNRQVSKLELELQGEVDKFLLIHLNAAGRYGEISPELFERQFERHSFGPGLSEDEVERYATASHFAAKYCSHLRSTCFNPLRMSDLKLQARNFFERDFPGKVARLVP